MSLRYAYEVLAIVPLTLPTGAFWPQQEHSLSESAWSTSVGRLSARFEEYLIRAPSSGFWERASFCRVRDVDGTEVGGWIGVAGGIRVVEVDCCARSRVNGGPTSGSHS